MKIFSPGGFLHPLKNLYLRLKNGAGCCDIYSLDYYLAKKMIKPLKAFRSHNRCSHPIGFKSMEEWDKCLDEMIWAFEFLLADKPATYYKNGRLDIRPERRCQKGFELFGKHFNSLWY